uniref:Uncharacterized protein n=1 Tax=Ixodes ricinus TaxID=34613 RepID=A0A6B0UZZ6_IXORI
MYVVISPYTVWIFSVIFKYCNSYILIDKNIRIKYIGVIFFTVQMSGTRRNGHLTEEEIQELIFLPDVDISDMEIDSDPDDPDYDPAADLQFINLCPLEVVRDIDTSMNAQEEACLPHRPSETLSTKPSDPPQARMASKRKDSRKWIRDDIVFTDHEWKGSLPHPPEELATPYEYFAKFF